MAALMEKCNSCSNAARLAKLVKRRIRDINDCTARYNQKIQKLLQELNEEYAEYARSNLDSDEGEGEHDTLDADTDDDKDSGCVQQTGYFCPEIECRERKADATFKKYSRHYTTHIPCTISCAGCHITLVSVSTAKRHFAQCAELKTKRGMVQHVNAIRQMKLAIDNATKGAYRSARTALQGHKRRCQTRSNMSRPNDEIALAKFQGDSSPPIASTPGSAKDRQQETGRSKNNEQRPQVSETQIAANTTSEENQQSMQNTFTTGTDASVVVSEVAREPLKCFDINQQTVVPDMGMAAVPSSVLNGARNDQSLFADNHDSVSEATQWTARFRIQMATINHQKTPQR
ncbi:hypothetical protein PWT90_03427 [Aphanocladium album]|nr:hypothetical protein PWT90_03427 [Aphanocladium album]